MLAVAASTSNTESQAENENNYIHLCILKNNTSNRNTKIIRQSNLQKRTNHRLSVCSRETTLDKTLSGRIDILRLQIIEIKVYKQFRCALAVFLRWHREQSHLTLRSFNLLFTQFNSSFKFCWFFPSFK